MRKGPDCDYYKCKYFFKEKNELPFFKIVGQETTNQLFFKGWPN